MARWLAILPKESNKVLEPSTWEVGGSLYVQSQHGLHTEIQYQKDRRMERDVVGEGDR